MIKSQWNYTDSVWRVMIRDIAYNSHVMGDVSCGWSSAGASEGRSPLESSHGSINKLQEERR